VAAHESSIAVEAGMMQADSRENRLPIF